MRLTGIVVAGALVVTACRTPYQPMGVTGGYSSETIGYGRHVVHVAVNGFTNRGTAMSYAYRRAGELCPTGYDVLDGVNGGTSMYVRNGNVVTEVNKPEVTLVVQCREVAPSPPPIAQAPPPVVGPRSDAPWWCATADNHETGLCERDPGVCETRRSDMITKGWPHGPCAPATAAACFRLGTATGVNLSCSPTLALCRSQRDFTRNNAPPNVQVQSECELTE